MCCGRIKCDTCYNQPKAIPIKLKDKAPPYTKVKPRRPNKSLVKR